MSTAIDLIVQDANVLLTTLKKYQPQLSEFGVTEGGIQEYENLVATLQQKDLAYKGAQNTKRKFTIDQNLQVERAREIIKKVKTASQVAFFNDKGKLLDFHKGKAIPSTVSGLVAETLYMKETAGLHTEALQARGIKAADLAEFRSIIPAYKSTKTVTTAETETPNP
jgi:hypothetical protein